MKQPLLAGKNIVKRFPQGKESVTVLQNADIEIYTGDFTVIMGPSGAGKSTLLYSLSGMDSISSGEIYYQDQEISKYSEKKTAELRTHAFGFVFQQTHLVSNLTLFENVAVAGYLDKEKTEKQVNAEAEQLLMKMHVGDAKHRTPTHVSGGEAQRAAIARAMINHPAIVFADEPTGALNRKNSDEVLGLFEALNREGQTIVMATHDLRCAVRGNRILYLEDGKILDELHFPPFSPDSGKQREETLSSWLTGLSW